MKYPFSQKKIGKTLLREFKQDVPSEELVWHRDRLDRRVKVVSGENWRIQLENRLPIDLQRNQIYYIPKNTYHRVIKGQGDLVVEIRETRKTDMRITEKQIRRIVREELLLREQSMEPGAEERMQLAIEDLPKLLQSVESNRQYAAKQEDDRMAEMYDSDAYQLETIHDMSKEALDNFGGPTQYLQSYISRIDTAVREEIPENLYNWIVGS